METMNEVLERETQLADVEKRMAFIVEVQARYEGILLQQAESIARLLSVVEKLAGHTERILDIIEVATSRLDQGDERAARFENILGRLVENSDRYAGEIRSLIEAQKQADGRVQTLVSAMGRFIGQH